jgi:hypothetical protein
MTNTAQPTRSINTMEVAMFNDSLEFDAYEAACEDAIEDPRQYDVPVIDEAWLVSYIHQPARVGAGYVYDSSQPFECTECGAPRHHRCLSSCSMF